MQTSDWMAGWSKNRMMLEQGILEVASSRCSDGRVHAALRQQWRVRRCIAVAGRSGGNRLLFHLCLPGPHVRCERLRSRIKVRLGFLQVGRSTQCTRRDLQKDAAASCIALEFVTGEACPLEPREQSLLRARACRRLQCTAGSKAFPFCT